MVSGGERQYRIARILGFVTAIGFAVSGTPAIASYYVSTAAFTEAGASTYVYNNAYNYNADISGVNLIGSNSFGGCPAVSPPITCSTSGGGTMSASTALTTANNQSQLTVGNTSIPYSIAAAASAVANLATGKVGVSASGDYDFVDPGSGQYGGKGSAYAETVDTLHLAVASASATTVTKIGVTFTVKGSWTVTTAQGDSGGSVTAFLQFGNGQFLQGISNTGGGWTPAVDTPTINGGWDSYTLSPDTPDQITFNGIYDLIGPSNDLGFDMRLGAACGLGTACDYLDTGAISLSLPGGVSLGSDSGVFLSAQSVPAPEPAALAVLAGAIGFFVPIRRGTRRLGRS
ncbi:MAG TPA: hypothetical protein VKI44_09120 [Acetobacteraceae bacterium]|nr:hypothetical protein [Acetobacteraceae bacterium]